MRFLLTFIGGLIAGVLLFLLMQQMTQNENSVPFTPEVVILPPVLEMPEKQPPVIKPDEKPQPPKPNPRPAGPTELPIDPTSVDPGPNSDTPTIEPGKEVNIDMIVPEPGAYRPGGQALCAVMIAPVYPRAAARAGTEGKVELLFTIQTDGSVADITVVSAQPRGVFEQAAKRAVAKWRCSPAVVDGKPVTRRVQQILKFQLDKAD